jgi:hypothetical protein
VPGYCGGQDIFSVGTLKGVGRVDEQTFIDTYTKVAFAKLYDRKIPITAADLLNDRVVPFFDEHDTRLSRVLTDRGTEDLLAERHAIEIEHGAVEALADAVGFAGSWFWSARGRYTPPLCRARIRILRQSRAAWSTFCGTRR